jgi:hypothetical protein
MPQVRGREATTHAPDSTAASCCRYGTRSAELQASTHLIATTSPTSLQPCDHP